MNRRFQNMSSHEAQKLVKEEILNNRFPDISFITAKGTEILMSRDKKEYRAYRVIHGRKEPLGLGATLPEGLVDYIKRKY